MSPSLSPASPYPRLWSARYSHQPTFFDCIFTLDLVLGRSERSHDPIICSSRSNILLTYRSLKKVSREAIGNKLERRVSSDEEGLSYPIRQMFVLPRKGESKELGAWVVRPVDSPLISDGREGAAFSRGEVLIVSHWELSSSSCSGGGCCSSTGSSCCTSSFGSGWAASWTDSYLSASASVVTNFFPPLGFFTSGAPPQCYEVQEQLARPEWSLFITLLKIVAS